jgi:hypothetical protein
MLSFGKIQETKHVKNSAPVRPFIGKSGQFETPNETTFYIYRQS